MPRLFRLATPLVLAALASLPALAEEAPRYNQISLQAEASREISHDLMRVTLYSEAQHKDPAQLAGDITRSLNAAVERARQVAGVKVSLGNRNSHPVYDDQGRRIVAWRERAELRLESADFAALSQLSADLLGELKIGDMRFAIADATRKKNEDTLLQDAVKAFGERARLATQALGGSGYKLVSLSLSSAGIVPPPFPRVAMMKSMDREAGAPAQEIEAGSSEVSIRADGVIEVQMP
ncbi:SIMPL domain-containing protein [Azotobacter chroococcum]|uniref:SIMPL domain-containing protein n=1 Tax=Azotobacter chroococcum TaxID=353 RepID=A0AA43Z8Q2_9GAMM|nr:SIMPL domain-containing protein [Azotobacter chroococcum]NHN78264.1 SIMPL domain-containing protein [Azotobacter chroococcum]